MFRAPAQTDGTPDTSTAVVTPGTEFAGDLTDAIDAANAQRMAYLKAGDAHSLARNYGTLALMGMSAAALFLGITADGNTSRDAITGLGLAGAGLLGFGSATLSLPRQRLYYGAAQTITCAITTTRPFLVTKQTYDLLERDLSALEDSISNLKSATLAAEDARDVLVAADPNITLPIIQQADVEIASAMDVRNDVESVYGNGRNLKSEIDGAGISLRLHVQHIMDTVDIEITRTEPSVQSLTTLLGGLSGVAGQIVPGVSFAIPEAPQTDVAELGPDSVEPDTTQLQTSLERLRAARDDAVRKADAVRPYVETANSLKDAVGTIDSCNIPVAESGFSVTPDVNELEVPAGETVNFEIFNESGVPTAAFAGPAPADSTVSVQLINGTYQAVVAIGAAAKGETVLVIRSGPGTTQKLIKLKIKAKQA